METTQATTNALTPSPLIENTERQENPCVDTKDLTQQQGTPIDQRVAVNQTGMQDSVLEGPLSMQEFGDQLIARVTKSVSNRVNYGTQVTKLFSLQYEYLLNALKHRPQDVESMVKRMLATYKDPEATPYARKAIEHGFEEAILKTNEGTLNFPNLVTLFEQTEKAPGSRELMMQVLTQTFLTTSFSASVGGLFGYESYRTQMLNVFRGLLSPESVFPSNASSTGLRDDYRFKFTVALFKADTELFNETFTPELREQWQAVYETQIKRFTPYLRTIKDSMIENKENWKICLDLLASSKRNTDMLGALSPFIQLIGITEFAKNLENKTSFEDLKLCIDTYSHEAWIPREKVNLTASSVSAYVRAFRNELKGNEPLQAYEKNLYAAILFNVFEQEENRSLGALSNHFKGLPQGNEIGKQVELLSSFVIQDLFVYYPDLKQAFLEDFRQKLNPKELFGNANPHLAQHQKGFNETPTFSVAFRLLNTDFNLLKEAFENKELMLAWKDACVTHHIQVQDLFDKSNYLFADKKSVQILLNAYLASVDANDLYAVLAPMLCLLDKSVALNCYSRVLENSNVLTKESLRSTIAAIIAKEKDSDSVLNDDKLLNTLVLNLHRHRKLSVDDIWSKLLDALKEIKLPSVPEKTV